MILPVNSSLTSLVDTTKNEEKRTASGIFQQVLEKALDTTVTPVVENSPTSSLQEISSTRFNLESPSPDIQGMADELLDMLDLYSNGLQDPETSLKSLAPILERINANADMIIEEAKNSPDTELKEIALESALMANSEYLKFQRGDYL